MEDSAATRVTMRVIATQRAKGVIQTALNVFQNSQAKGLKKWLKGDRSKRERAIQDALQNEGGRQLALSSPEFYRFLTEAGLA